VKPRDGMDGTDLEKLSNVSKEWVKNRAEECAMPAAHNPECVCSSPELQTLAIGTVPGYLNHKNKHVKLCVRCRNTWVTWTTAHPSLEILRWIKKALNGHIREVQATLPGFNGHLSVPDSQDHYVCFTPALQVLASAKTPSTFP